MSLIVPAIMPTKFEELVEKVSLVESVADLIQIDIMDGVFVRGRTWPYPIDAEAKEELLLPDGLPNWERVDYELDLMVKKPEESFSLWAGLGPASIVIHYETVRDWEKLLGHISKTKDYISFGISFDDDFDKKKVLEKIDFFDYVQCMGIDEIGKQGNPFSQKTIDNIKFFKDRRPEMLVTVDGSVNFDTVKDLSLAGADRFVAGSVVFNYDNPAYQVEALSGLLQ